MGSCLASRAEGDTDCLTDREVASPYHPKFPRRSTGHGVLSPIRHMVRLTQVVPEVDPSTGTRIAG